MLCWLLCYRVRDRLRCTVALAAIARMFFSFLAVLLSSPIESVRLPDDAISIIAPPAELDASSRRITAGCRRQEQSHVNRRPTRDPMLSNSARPDSPWTRSFTQNVSGHSGVHK
jgi:hypothetical protein